MSNKDMPGNYQNRCSVCEDLFMGQKWDRVCGKHAEYHKCDRECTAYCVCLENARRAHLEWSDAEAALAELEKRNA